MAMSLRRRCAIRGEKAIAERPDGVRVPFVPYPTLLHEADGRLTGAINILIDISAHNEADARQRGSINELNYRVKNTLASMQAIVSRTLRGAVDLKAARRSVDQRLVALARTHDLLTTESWRSAGLRAVADRPWRPSAQTPAGFTWKARARSWRRRRRWRFPWPCTNCSPTPLSAAPYPPKQGVSR
jgi:hypothetical protein